MIHNRLVKAAIKGNESAFETLIKHESDKLYRTAFLYVKNKDDALDILQETVTKAFVSIHQLKNPDVFSSWLMKILIRTAYAFLNKKKKMILTGDEFLGGLPDSENQNIEQKLDLTAAISDLGHDYQTVIILFYYHDLSIKEIAETLKKPEGTIKTSLHRAKKALKKRLEGVNQIGKTVV